MGWEFHWISTFPSITPLLVRTCRAFCREINGTHGTPEPVTLNEQV